MLPEMALSRECAVLVQVPLKSYFQESLRSRRNI